MRDTVVYNMMPMGLEPIQLGQVHSLVRKILSDLKTYYKSLKKSRECEITAGICNNVNATKEMVKK